MKISFVKCLWGMRALLNKPFFNKIGIPSYIGKPIFIEGKKRICIGRNVRIFPGIRLEAIDDGEIVIGDNTAIEQNVHITSKGGILKIGKDCTILANSFVTNIDHDYRDVEKSILEQKVFLRTTRIGDGCFIGAGSAIQAGTILGKHCVVGTNSVVRGKYPDYCVLVGAPAKIIKKYNVNSGKWEKASK